MRMLLLLTALCGAQEARADAAWPKRMHGLYIGGGATFLGNESIGGPALTTDYAIGHGRWMFGGETTAQWLPDAGIDVRAGALVRYLARSFRPDSSASIELYGDASPGVEVIAANGAKVVRPDLRIGGGLQVRMRRVAIRIGLRITFAPPIDRDVVEAIACHGECMSPITEAPVIDDGMQVVLGVAW
jgi:hypothetical protein